METQIERHVEPAVNLTLEGGWALIPLLATMGSAWAFSPDLWTDNPAKLAIAMGLILGGWQSLWRALTRTDWATPLGRWPGWSTADPLPVWPYVQPGTPGASLHTRIGYARAWWREVGRTRLARPLKRAITAVAVSLLLSSAMGEHTLLMSLGFLAWTELAVLWHEGHGTVGPMWMAAATVGLPWFLGATLNGGDLFPAAGSALALTLMIGFYSHPNGWAILGPPLGAAFLVWQGHAAAVGWMLLLALPGLITLTARPDRQDYRHSIGPWVIAMVAVFAWVL